MEFPFPEEAVTRELAVFVFCLAALLVYLAVERIRLGRSLRAVPLRIGVTGTRGKSGVARLVAAGLRERGRRVLAKTTGSKPVLILPDGTEREIPRAGPPSIREQIRLMNLARGMGAEAVVAEFMSIGGECLAVESGHIVRPGILALTNVRLDHLDEMGYGKEEIARTLSAAIPAGGTVFVPREEVYPVFEDAAARLRAQLVPVEISMENGGAVLGRKVSADMLDNTVVHPVLSREFEPNLRLALGILSSLGLPRDKALEGMAKAVPDFGSLRIWRKRLDQPPRDAYFVSAFAANDPESSAAVIEKIKDVLPPAPRAFFGILCLRADRGDRTLQWIKAAEEGFFDDFDRVAVLGVPARAALLKLKRRLGPGIVKFFRPKDPDPESVVAGLLAGAEREAVVFGLGNIAGFGERFVRHWEETGVPYVR